MRRSRWPSFEERFFGRVQVSPTGCWLWMGPLNKGYGQVQRDHRRLWVHRASHEFFIGPIPDGLQVDHLCRVTNCVNPRHLEAVTARVNTLRSTARSALQARQTRCIHGHPFDDANTRLKRTRRGGIRRDCRTCHRSRERRRRVAA